MLRIRCTWSWRLWSSRNENMLRCIDMQNGSVVDSDTLRIKPIDICINDDDEVFVCNDKSVYNKRCVFRRGACFSTPFGWSVKTLAITRMPISKTYASSARIPTNFLIFLCREDCMQSKVVKTITSQLAQSEYQYDSEGKDLYNSNCSTNHLRQGELPLTRGATS